MASEIVVNEFVAETREHLNDTELDLLEMENGRDARDADRVNRLFRAIHSIKGASGTFGFHAIMELSHAMEGVLLLFRDGKLVHDRDKINVLLEGVDKLRFMINDLHASDAVDCQSEILKLHAIMKGEDKTAVAASGNGTEIGTPEPSASAPVCPDECNRDSVILQVKDSAGSHEIVFEADKTQIASAVSRRHYVCAIQVRQDRDLQEKQRTPQDFSTTLQSYGQCLDTKFHFGSEEKGSISNEQDHPLIVLFATILEPDLIGAALDIPEEQIHVLDFEYLEESLQKEPAPPMPTPPAQPRAETVCLQQVQVNDGPVHPVHETIRINVELLDTLINLAGELVLGRNQLRQMLEASADENPRLRSVIHNVNLVTSEMQEHILRMRMQPVNNIFNRIRRLVRDLARQLEKEVDFITGGGEVELDKSILEGLTDPLNHIIRNCLDHGIETPRERIAAGKSTMGEIRLRAFHEAGQVNIAIADDGRGMDLDDLVEKAIGRGILTVEDARKMKDQEKINLIFLPGFSTAKTVTDVSGRGVGMDVVKNNIERFGGHIEIDSLAGTGTTIHITIPLTLAIIPSLIVGAGKQRFAIPQVNVRELVCIGAEDTARRLERVGEAPVLRLRERLLPLVRLVDTVGLDRTFVHPATGEEMADRRINIADRRRLQEEAIDCAKERRQLPLGRRQSQQSAIFVVVLRVGGNLFGLIVDELFDIEEIVVKPLSDHTKDCQCFAGATIMGDGRVAMILDAGGIAALAKLRFAEVNAEQLRRQTEEKSRRETSAAERQSILVFNNTLQEQFAVPLASISRLEKIVPEMVERIGDHEFMAYCGRALPLIRLEDFVPVRPLPDPAEELYVIIPKAGDSTVGIVVSRIVDTFETSVIVDKVAETPRGFLGSAIVESQITMFLDIDELLRMYEKSINLHCYRQKDKQAP